MRKKINGKELPSHTQESSPFVSYYSVLIVKLCSILLLEAEADPCVDPPFVRQVGSEVSRVGSVQVGVPVHQPASSYF